MTKITGFDDPTVDNPLIRVFLSNTTDPQEAAKLADQLGESAYAQSLLPKALRTCFPPEWVLSKQKGSAKMAAYAIEHCDDADTLLAIASKPSKRKLVHAALRANPFLAQANLTPVPGKVRATKVANAAQSADEVARAQLAKLLKRVAFPYLEPNPLWFLEDSALSSELIDEAFLKLEAEFGGMYHQTVASRYVFAKCGVEVPGSYDVCWKRGTLSAEEVLARRDVDDQDILEYMISSLKADRYTKTDSTAVIDADVTRRIVKLRGSRWQGDNHYRNNDSALVRPTFSAEAIDILLATPKWAWLATYEVLSLTQMQKLVKVTKEPQKADLLTLVHGERDLTEVVLASLQGEINDYWQFLEAASSLGGPSDPLWPKLLKKTDAWTVLTYMFCNASDEDGFDSERWPWPRVDMIPMLLSYAQIALDESYGVEFVGDGFKKVYSESHAVYLRAVIDLVPGALEYGAEHEELSEYIYSRLVATGAQREMIVDQFNVIDRVSLNQLCDILGAITRATARS